MFKVRIIPISGGTPQELAYAESAVRTLGQMSRALMLGAPHLPSFCWGLSDYQAAYIHALIPQQSRLKRSPHEITTGRKHDRAKTRLGPNVPTYFRMPLPIRAGP